MILVLHTLGFLSASDNGWNIKNANFYNNMYWNSRYTNFWCKTTFCDFPCCSLQKTNELDEPFNNLLIQKNIYYFSNISHITKLLSV